ncbi:hypothetical protein OIO90_002081 [Microbotryomycetes sp. JL221]|nr:hypothetical protein OIO90_002081 [Microbotryomycetes sp. JL221]
MSTTATETTATPPAVTQRPAAGRAPLLAPPKGKYRLSNLVNVPNRLIRPGSLIEKDLEQLEKRDPNAKFNGATAGVVRGSRIKLCEVQLEDVLSGKMTPPVSLRDFEDFLCFRTKSAENLYFEVWLRQYVALYNQSSPATRSHTDILALQDSYRTALDVFLSTSSPLELNLPAEIRRTLDGHVQDLAQRSNANPSIEAFLPPEAFAAAHKETSESLATSFKQFLLQVSRNADRNRARFAMFLGVLTWALGLVPTIVCAVLGKSRAWRCLGLLFWFLGPLVFVGGLKRTCALIYLFGDSRQLYPWELARESANGSSFYSDGTSSTMVGLEEGKFETSSEKSSPFPGGSGDSRRSSATFPDFNYYPLRPASETEKSFRSSSKSTTSATTPSGLYFAPVHISENLPPSSKVWAPFTRLWNPIVARAQRDIVAAAAGYGLIVMCITAAICLSVPNRDV